MFPTFLLAGLAILMTSTMTDRAHAAFAHAYIFDKDEKQIGRATLSDIDEGVLIKLHVALPQGIHAFHIHETGTCIAPDFKSAGGHFNPEHKEHGMHNPAGSHAGDLPNLTVDELGHVEQEIIAKGISLKGGDHPLMDENAAALVIHAEADDYKSDPTGNAGGRIACGVIIEGEPLYDQPE